MIIDACPPEMIEEIYKANADWEEGPPSTFSFDRINATVNDGFPNTSRALQNLDQTRIVLDDDSTGRKRQLLSAFDLVMFAGW